MANQRQNVLRVTFDTNVCDILHQPDRRTEIMPRVDADELRNRVRDGGVSADSGEQTQ
jgi:hypothetical protein